MNSRRTLVVVRWTMAAGALAGIVLVYSKWFHVNPTTVALSLLLLVLVLAAQWGLRYAVVVSIFAAACYNYFFLPPFLTFTVADTQNWLALLAFLCTAIVASRLSQRARDEAEEARSRQRELDTLFRLSRELLQSESMAGLLSSLPATVTAITSAQSGYLYLLEGDRLYQAGGAHVSELEIPHLKQLSSTLTKARREGDEIWIPLRSGVRPKGLFSLRQSQVSNETADGMASLISLAVDRVQALENLARGEAAKESDRLRTLMIDSITHELRTPLTSIKGAATTLLSGVVDEEDRVELLNIMDEECDRLNRLVSEAVEMSQLDSQQVKMNRRRESLLHLVEKASEACAWVKTSHPVHIEIPASIAVEVDPNFFSKVICNLLENAAKYSEPQTPITITAEATDEQVSLSVADRGIGIDESEQGLIFERFYRSMSGSRSASGTGMGLAISRAIIQAHGGEISVTSQPGRGSVFTIRLPLRTGQEG